MRVERSDTGFIIDAGDLGALFEMAPEEVRRMVREGSITTRVEKGEHADHGRFRLSFLAPERRVQLVVDEAGEVLRRTRTSRPGNAGQ